MLKYMYSFKMKFQRKIMLKLKCLHPYYYALVTNLKFI